MARFILGLMLLFGLAGTAQASCTGALPMTCTPGVTPASTDLVLGGQNGQTVKFTVAQLTSGGGGGVVTQGTIPWVDSITGTVTVVQPTGTNLHIVCDSGCSGSGGGGNVNVTQWDTINLGAPSAYGTSPGAVTVPGVNAFVTNPVAVTQSTGTNLHMVCDSGCSSSTAPADGSAFTFGTTSQTPVGGVFQTTATSNPLTTGEMGAFQVTANRALFANLRNAAGAEVGVAATPLQVSVANTAANGTAIAVSAASLPLPALAATSTKQSDGTQKTQIVDGSGNVIASTSNNLDVQCANCSGSGVSTADAAAFTAGASLFAGGGGFFQTTATSNPLTTGQQGMFQVTANRALFSNLRNAAGTEVGTASTPMQVSVANTGANGTAIAVSAASLPLPTGASTSAKQPALGTAGTASTDVITVQGIASMTPLLAAESGTWNITNISGTVSLPTGAATAAKQPALGTAGTASADVITVQGIASMTPLLAAESGTWNITNISGTVSLPTGAATSANQPTPATGGTILSAASNNSTSIKASAGTLYTVIWLNTTATLMDIRFYDTASTPTCSSATSMKLNFVAQANTTSPGAGLNLGPAGIAFTTGIGVCITGANANNDNTSAATGLNLIYSYN